VNEGFPLHQISKPGADYRHFRKKADATEFIGTLSAFTGLLDPRDEVIVFQPLFDRYVLHLSWPLCHDAILNIYYTNAVREY
jgi:hypothetical protein